MIDEKKLIEFIDAGHLRNPEEKVFSENDVVNIINAQPKIGQWIPVEERLPSEEERDKYDTEFIVMIKGATLPTALKIKRNRDVWIDDMGNTYKVIAWRLFPEPYKPQPTEWKERMMEHFTKGE